MHPVWEKLAQHIEKVDYKKAHKAAHTRRMPLLLLVLLIGMTVVAGTGILLNQYGSYCEYPDPYGR